MRRRGFTLVELLVVIGIIAMLISILLPTLGRARAAAQAIKCESNIRQLGLTMIMYANENKGIFPVDSDWRYTNSDGDRFARPFGWWDDPSIWINAACNYAYHKSYYRMILDAAAGTTVLPNNRVGASSLFVCPGSIDAGPSTANAAEVANNYLQVYAFPNPIPNPPTTPYALPTNDMGDPSNGVAPQPSTVHDVFTCYAFNSKLNSTGMGNGVNSVKQNQLHDATITALIVEKRVNPSEVVSQVSAQYGSPKNNDLPTRRMARIKADWSYFTGRHQKGGYICMADGHVQFFTMSELCLPPGYNPASYTAVDFNQTGKIIWDPFAKTTP